MPSYDDLRGAADAAWKVIEQPARPLFLVSINTSSIAAGALETFDTLSKLAPTAGFDLMRTGDTGISWQEPVIEVVRPGGQRIVYGLVTAEKAEAFATAAAAGVAKEHVIGVAAGDPIDGVANIADLDWAKPQVRWLMRNCGVIDPDQIEHYVARGGYEQYMAASKRDRDELIHEITGSTLKGHSGSFFSTGTKWNFLKTATGEPKYLVCNADEGDPGDWVNRVLMESDPHSILEGMLIGAFATGASHGWIYIRDEYPLAIDRMNRAIEQCREHGVFGEDALGTGVNFNAEVVRGAGAYVCGDETGLISSVNDERGMPRIKPPFPAQRGVLDRPTNVNNVETYACVTALLRLGAETYSTVGTENNRGTKMFTVSGAVERTGCFEVPFGMTVNELLAAAGGIAGGRAFKALQQGGPLCGLLPASIAGDLALEPEPFRPLGAGMGGGGLVFIDDTACVVDLNVMFAQFLEDESCGRCTTCHGGNQRLVEILRRASRGQGEGDDIQRIKSLAASLQYSNCLYGTLSPTIIMNTLTHFRDEYDEHALRFRCSAKVCEGLIRYRVIAQAPALAEAADICPTDAIVQASGGWQIEDAKCIRCNACKELVPDAIAVEDLYIDAIPLRVVAPADVARAGGPTPLGAAR